MTLKTLPQNIEIMSTGKGTTAIDLIRNHQFDLVILDLNLKDIRGENVIRRIREISSDLNTIILTAESELDNKLYELGADNFFSKPFDVDTLATHISSLLERQEQGVGEQKIDFGDLVLDTNKYELICGDQVVELSSKEFELIKYLIINKERYLTRSQIITSVWKMDKSVETRSIDMYVSKLRSILDEINSQTEIVSKKSVGYMLTFRKNSI
jgi:DNA-binding response OmpR family regulator